MIPMIVERGHIGFYGMVFLLVKADRVGGNTKQVCDFVDGIVNVHVIAPFFLAIIIAP